jgi:hypothetical protein
VKSLGFAISDTVTAKIDAPRIERLITNERNPSKDLMTTSVGLAPFGVVASVTEELAGTGSALVASLS